MKFIEVDAVFIRMFEPGEKATFIDMYGDNMEDWPADLGLDKDGPVCINIDRIDTFNRSSREGETTLRMSGDDVAYRIKMEYADFKRIVNNACK